jgi:hypothetical protein
MPEPALRIAMWSGPRNLSTAMMRSFENRADTVVSDEPFYGAFLKHTGEPHPMAAEVIAAMDCDWHSVAASLAGPCERPIWYQKHMVHHMVGPLGLADMPGFTHAFLIRAPERVVASYLAKREVVDAEALGFARQHDWLQREADRLGRAPPVVDSADVLADPAGTLTRLCAALGISFDAGMLHWPAGPRASPPPGWAWAEVALRLITPPRAGRRAAWFELVTAQLRAHLAMAEVGAVVCSLFTFFCHGFMVCVVVV